MTTGQKTAQVGRAKREAKAQLKKAKQYRNQKRREKKMDFNPRTENDNLGTMVTGHRKYNLGDVQKDSPTEIFEEILEEVGAQMVDGMDYDDLGELVEEYTFNLPLYLYDHSGITMSTTPFSCRWDSGQVGYIYVAKDNEEIKGKTEEEVLSLLKVEVKEYDDYLTGNDE